MEGKDYNYSGWKSVKFIYWFWIKINSGGGCGCLKNYVRKSFCFYLFFLGNNDYDVISYRVVFVGV